MKGHQDLTTPVSRAIPIRLQALSGMYLCLVYLKNILVLPLQAMQRENFSYFFPVPSCAGFCFCFWVFLFYLLYPDFLLLCVCFYCPAKTRPCTISSSSPDLWYQIAGLCPAPFCVFFSFTMEYPVTARNRRKRAGWDHAFPFLQ